MPVVARSAYIGLGANLGDARATVLQALADLKTHPAVRLVAASSLYKTAPWQADGGDYINAVAHVHTSLEPLVLLEFLQSLEQGAGRQRSYRNAPRTLDLDLLWFDGVQLDTPVLTLPHPRMFERAFVLKPLAQVAPHLVTEAHLCGVQDQRIALLEP